MGTSVEDYILWQAKVTENLIKEEISAAWRAVGRPFRGMSLQDFRNLPKMTKIQVWESEGGRSVMKSMLMCDQGRCGMGSGTSFSAGSCRGVLVEREGSLATWLSKAQ